jgi:hypothetical protein
MERLSKLVLLVTSIILVPVFCFAAQIGEKDIIAKKKVKKFDLEPQKTFVERGKVKNLVSVSQGYDNNTYLDSARKGDSFTQTYFKSIFTSPLNNKLDAILSYELMSLVYSEQKTLDLVTNRFNIGVDRKINKDLNFTANYYLDLFEYINTGNDDFVENGLEFKLKQNLPLKSYHSLGYGLSVPAYSERLIRTNEGLDSDKKRDDIRNTVGYEIGKYFEKDLFKVSYEYYNNNSNEPYLKYYDYDSYKIGASLTHIFNDKFFAYLSLSRKYRDFRSRTLSLDANFKEWDRTYLLSSALYYNLNKSLTLGLSYSYRENGSNEPLENYSGSIVSLGTYYRF